MTRPSDRLHIALEHFAVPGNDPRTAATRCIVVSLGCSLLVLAGCARSDPERGSAHPALQCLDSEQQFNPPVEIDISGPGSATADAALRAALEPVVRFLGGGEIVVSSPTSAAVEVDSRTVHVSTAAQNARGEWHVVDHFYCG